MKFRNKDLIFNKKNIYVMGILNVTPDSFSDGGKYNNIDSALFQAERMINEGADMIDIGGESTRPFSEPVSENEEIDRVVPVIKKINENFNTVISIDTYKSKIAELACRNGAEIINDISGFTFDNKMIDIAQKYNTAAIIMHIKGTPKNMQNNPVYDNVVLEVYDFLKSKVEELKSNGLEKIIIDIGFGFGKSLNDNYILLNNLKKYSEIGCPVLAGISRKSMIGNVVVEEPENRVPGTIALNTVAMLNGASILRVHDVKENYQAVKVIKKCLNTE